MIGTHDAEAVAEFPELNGLIELRERGWTLQPLTNSTGEIVVIHGTRFYFDGWVDALGVRYTTQAHALRNNPDGGQVWKRTGSLTEVLDALRDLPHPLAPHAPRLVLGTTPTLWTPSSHRHGSAALLGDHW
jgi:hypothetical protein